MIGVLTLFGETDLQKTLQKEFVKNDLIFVSENAKTSVQLLSIIEKNAKETDVVIISAGAITLSLIFEIIDEIWKAKNSIRVIVILNGGREQYLKSQLTEFRARGIDIIFDDRGFDIQRLIQFAKKGPLKKKIEDEKVIENTVADILSDAENEKPAEKSITENETLETDLNTDSFSEFRGHYCVGIMNTTHGAGATMLAQKIATCFALQNVHTAIVDYSGTEALSLIKIKGVDYITEPQTLRQLRKKYNAVIIDFGTPYIISPKGNNFTRDIDFQMRDLETVQNAITMAETGHVVYGTLHAKSVTESIDRIIDIFPPKQQEQIRMQLANVLKGVMHQTMIRTLSGGITPLIELLAVDDVVSSMILNRQKTNTIRDYMRGKAVCGNVHIIDNAVWHIDNSRIDVNTLKNILNADDYNIVRSILNIRKKGFCG